MSRARSILVVSLFCLAVVPVGQAGADNVCGEPPAMEPLSFDQPQIIDDVRAGGEPSVEGLPDGTLMYASHASTTLFHRDKMPDAEFATPYHGGTYLWRSTDNGDTWRYVGTLGVEMGPHATISGFSDPDFAVDAAGNVYTAGINLANVYVAKSGDSGKTWAGHPFGTVATDREWLAADEEDVLYMNGNFGLIRRTLWKSTDGGLTFPDQLGIQLPGAGPPSKIEVDKSDGRLFFPTGDGSVAIYPNARNNDFTRIDAAIPGGGGSHAHGFLNNLSIDRAGNVYHIGNSGTQIFVSYSTDRGLTWTTQMVHNASPNVVLWPWISAGDDGRVGISWFQGDRPVGNTNSTTAAYRVWAAQTVTGHGWVDDCGQQQPPVWDKTIATPEPFHTGTICSEGTTCQAAVPNAIDRRLGDYHTNHLSAGGKMLIAYSDTSLKPESAVSKPGFIRQKSGINFYPDGVVAPTQVIELNASLENGTLSVGGAAAFGGQAPVTIGESPAGNGPLHPELANELGVDLRFGRIYQSDPDEPVLTFEWKVNNLPATGSIPEGVRYLFPFRVGQQLYQLQAKYTNVASVTLADDPAGHARAPGHFQLRGNCVDNYPIPEAPLANCPHIAWLDGEIDVETDTVRIFMPLDADFAQPVRPGATLERNVVANSTISAAFQAVASLNPTMSDEAPWEEGVTFQVPTKDVLLGVAPAGTPASQVSFDTPGTLDGNGFSGAVDVSGLEPGDYAVYARACFADNCGTAEFEFTI